MSNQNLWDLIHLSHDPRREQGRRHRLGDMIATTFCAVIAGAAHGTEIEEFGLVKEEWFRTFLELPHGIPSHDTFGRLFAALDPDAFEKVCRAWTQALSEHSGAKHLAIDGKTLRHSFDRASKRAAIHMISAWATEAGLCFGQFKVDGKGNEITAIPELLKTLALKGATVTTDAIGCQRKIAEQINCQQGYWLFGLKGNQSSLHDDVKLYLDGLLEHGRSRDLGVVETTEKGHGRIETRRCWVDTRVDWLNQRHGWPKPRLCLVKR